MNAPFSEKALEAINDEEASEKLTEFLQSTERAVSQDIQIGDFIYTIRKIGFKSHSNDKNRTSK